MLLTLLVKGCAAAALLLSAAVPPQSDYRDDLAAGSVLFKQGLVQKSVESFNRAAAAQPTLAKYFWQRGISQYYVGQYEECYEQFQADAVVSKADAEELLWSLLCKAGQERSVPIAQQALASQGLAPDARAVMVDIQKMYRGDVSIDDILRRYDSLDKKGSRDFFYSRLYASLLEAAAGDTVAAEKHAAEALASSYGSAAAGRDYMVDVAAVQLKARQGGLDRR